MESKRSFLSGRPQDFETSGFWLEMSWTGCGRGFLAGPIDSGRELWPHGKTRPKAMTFKHVHLLAFNNVEKLLNIDCKYMKILL